MGKCELCKNEFKPGLYYISQFEHERIAELEAEIERLKTSNKILRRAVLRLARDEQITISKANELLGNVSIAQTRRQVFALERNNK